MSNEETRPILIGRGPNCSRIKSICRENSSAFTGRQRSNRLGFCAVRVVIADNPKTPRDKKVRRSAVTPAKEQGSNPAIVRHFKGWREKGKEEDDKRKGFIVAKISFEGERGKNFKISKPFLDKEWRKVLKKPRRNKE